MKKYLILFLLAIISFISCEEKAIDIVDSRLIPEQTSMIIFINTEKLLATKGVLEALRKDRDFNNLKEELITKAKINIEKDLKKVMLSYNDTTNSMSVYANLNYNKENTLKTLKANKEIKHKTIMDYDVITKHNTKSLNKQANKKNFALALINNTNILITEEKNINTALNIIKGKGNTIKSESTIYKQIKRIEHHNILWGLVNLSKPFKKRIPKKPKSQNLINRYLENIELISFGMERKDKNAKLFISSINKDIKATKLLYSNLDSLINLGKSLYPPQSNEAKLIKSIKLTQKAKELIIEVFASENDLEKVIVKNIKDPIPPIKLLP